MPLVLAVAAAPELATAGITLAEVAEVLTVAGKVLIAGHAIVSSVDSLKVKWGL